MDNNIIELEVDKLIPNPHNPRKDLGDILELTMSIQAKGIMQNLTVIPQSEDSDKYIVLIGHRRLAAAQAAGLKTVPCKIIDNMPISEQIGVMLLENIQRNDLTIPEQAQSFQMMLDLGDTVEGIVNKTGFSKSTIHHRLNIAKLDQEVLEKRLNDQTHQITLKDLMALEAVESVEKRNEILSNSYDSQDIARRANAVAKEEERTHIANVIYKHLERLGIKPLPEEHQAHRWDRRWDTIKEISLDKGGNRFQEIEGLKAGKTTLDTATIEIDGDNEDETYECPVYYIRWPYADYISVIADEQEMLEEEGEYAPTEADLERERREKNRKAVLDAEKRLKTERDDFIRGVVSGKIPDKTTTDTMGYFWLQMIRNNVSADIQDLYDFCYGDIEKPDDEKEAFVMRLSPCLQMIIMMHEQLSTWKDLADYQGRYCEDNAEEYISLYLCLEEMGFKLEEEDEMLIYGTSKLYNTPDEE